jgi:hypothetical protein
MGELRRTDRLARFLRAGAFASVLACATIVHAQDQTTPQAPPGTKPENYDPNLFGPDPNYVNKPYDPAAQDYIYGGKHHNPTPRPPLELGQRQYEEGPLDSSFYFPFGEDNPTRPALSVYGDFRTAIAYNVNGKNSVGTWANRLDLDMDLRLTSTERVHAVFRPFDHRKTGFFTRCDFAGNTPNGCHGEFDMNPEALFFEGDIASLYAGATSSYMQRDVPFAVGLVPLFLQNGIWFDAAMLGGAVTLPHINSPGLDISNMDITVFSGFDNVTTNAIVDKTGQTDDHGSQLFGITAFIEALGGYIETGYGYTQDVRVHNPNFSYNNVAFAYTWRFRDLLSQSFRVIGNFGQDPGKDAKGHTIAQTANGTALLFENSLITPKPYTLVPYMNAYVGVDRTQSLSRDNGGILKNTGINFRTDNLTGFPKLDDSAVDSWGGALGVEYLFNFDQQVVLEVATVQLYGPSGLKNVGRQAKGNQYALGLQYQIPLNERLIFIMNGMYGLRQNDKNLGGVRAELEVKF